MKALLVMALLVSRLPALEDPGKACVGMVKVEVYHATGDASRDQAPGTAVDAALATRLQREATLSFSHYRLLGSDTQELYRSYENWAEPLKPSDEVMVRFEAQSTPTRDQAILDLELWLGRKKTIKADAILKTDQPLFVLGPSWRKGRLIISISFTQPNPS